MTNAEAIETLRANYPDACYEQLREAVDAAIEALKLQHKAEWTAEELDYLNKVESTTKTTQDWVMVVRCKDCKWWTKQEASLQGRCDAYGMYPTEEWYCARGERR